MKTTSKKNICKCNAGQDVPFGEYQGEVNSAASPRDLKVFSYFYWPIMEGELSTTQALIKKSRESEPSSPQDDQNFKLNLVAIIDGIIRVNALLENLIGQQNPKQEK